MHSDAIGLHHPLDSVTNPGYKLLHLIQPTFFSEMAEILVRGSLTLSMEQRIFMLHKNKLTEDSFLTGKQDSF